MYYTKNHFPELSFCGTHNKPYGVRVLSKHYHVHFNIKLGHFACAICCITLACEKCKSTLDKSWTPGVLTHLKPCYEPVKYFTY